MASTALVFRTPLENVSTAIVFGDPSVELGDANAVFSATLPAPTLSALVARPVLAAVSATLPAPTLTGEAFYDNAVHRGPGLKAASDWQQAAKQANGARVTMDQGIKANPTTRSPWGAGDAIPSQVTADHADAIRLKNSPATRWTDAVPVRSQAVAEHKDTLKHARIDRGTRFSDAKKLGALKTGDMWDDMLRHARPQINAPWGDGKAVRLDHSHDWQNGKRHRLNMLDEWQDARKPPPGLFVIPITPPITEEGCYDPPAGNQVALLFDEAFTGSPHLVFLCRGEEPNASVTVPIRRAYIVINELTLKRVSNDLALPCFGLSLNIDADSWTWGFTASLPASALADVEPAGFGDPVELDAEINGVHYRLLAEQISRDRSFGSAKINVSGRGKSAILAEPYSPAVNFSNVADRTAQQLMGDVLTTNGAPLGWSLEWNVTDWLVPAGVFSHQGSYMSAVNAIAGAIGGYILPHPTNNVLRVMNRYPVAPWEWNTVTPDLELPSAAVSKEGIAWADRPNYNAVYLSGTAGGVLSQVKRTGTAGDIIAPMVTDPLLTRTDAHRQRGISILGNTGRIATVTLELPVLPETGIIEPGKFIRYTDGATQRIGIVRSTNVSAGLPRVSQTLEVETHA